MKFPGVVAVLCVIPSGLVLHIGHAPFPLGQKCPRKITMKKEKRQASKKEEKIVQQRLMRKNEISNRKEKILLKQMAKKTVSCQLKIG